MVTCKYSEISISEQENKAYPTKSYHREKNKKRTQNRINQVPLYYSNDVVTKKHCKALKGKQQPSKRKVQQSAKLEKDKENSRTESWHSTELSELTHGQEL